MSSSTNPLNSNTVNVATSGTTDKGTKILRKTDNTMDKNSFLKILSAQLMNQDPTSQNQDSSAYVSQMAQFASMEQMQNLNTTMSDSAYQQMVGKTVITNEKDDNNAYIQGYVNEVTKKSGGTYLNITVDGKDKEIAAENIIGVVETKDINIATNSRTALNSDFIAASDLAAGKKNVVIAEIATDGTTTFTKGTVTGAYIDTVSNVAVKIKVDVKDTDGNSTIKTFNYGDIVVAGDLTTEEMDSAISTVKTAADAAAAKVAADAAAAKAAATTAGA